MRGVSRSCRCTRSCGYLSAGDAVQLISNLEEIGRMLNSMIAKAALFCGATDYILRETTVDYFTAATPDY
jgi:hypothetical protein